MGQHNLQLKDRIVRESKILTKRTNNKRTKTEYRGEKIRLMNYLQIGTHVLNSYKHNNLPRRHQNEN